VARFAADFYFPSAEQLHVPERFRDVQQTLPDLWSTAITIAGVIFMVLLLVGGVLYLTNAGNEDGTKKATRLMVDAVVGLVLVLLAWPAGLFVLSLLDQGKQFEGVDQVNDVNVSSSGAQSTNGTSSGTSGSTNAGDNAQSGAPGTTQTVLVQLKGQEIQNVPAALVPNSSTQNKTSRRPRPGIETAHAADALNRFSAVSNAVGQLVFRGVIPGSYVLELESVPVWPIEVTPPAADATGEATMEWITVDVKSRSRLVVVSVLDKRTQQPVPNFSFKVWQRELLNSDTDLLIDGLTDASGKTSIWAPEGELIYATATQSTAHELGEYQVPAQDGTAWVIFVSQESVVNFSFEVINQNGLPVVGRNAVVRDSAGIIANRQTDQYGRIVVSGKVGSALWLDVNGNQLCQAILPPQNAQVRRCQMATINEDASQSTSTNTNPPRPDVF
jgi:hypothetical protein